MKIKKPLIRSAVIVTVVVLSILIGLLYDAVWRGIDRKNYPQSYIEYVSAYSKEYGVPEYVIYGVIKYESAFDPANVTEDGRVGLMGFDEDSFNYVLRLEQDSLDLDSRYGPETSIKYGTYLLATLHGKLGSWEAVYAAKSTDLSTWLSWLDDDSAFDDDGVLSEIPDKTAEAAAEKISKYVQKYRDMYYD